MNSKTTKQAVPANATKTSAVTSGKQSRQAAVAGGMDNGSATQAAPAQRKRRKPFVL
jgi:hypothetical protein